jgi:uncharacterized protein with PQ loop repeat
MISDKGSDRFSALNLVLELVSTAITFWVFFSIRLIKDHAYSDNPITLFQWIVFIIQDIVGTTRLPS